MIDLIGHFHPLLVHLPIGILILALVISLLPEAKRAVMRDAFNLALLVAAFSSAAASIAGYLLANSGDYEPDLVNNHQWAGIATSVACFLAWLTSRYKRQILWGSVALMITASHMGGTLTHGEGYLFSSPENEQALTDSSDLSMDTTLITVSDTGLAQTAAKQQVFLYRDQISPILKNKCYNCHSAVKKKGGLRLDTESFINKGGKNGGVLVKGNPNKSAIYTNLLLPLEDEKHMPPKGKKQLSRGEIELIHRWIQKGAPFGAIEITTIEPLISASPMMTEPVAPARQNTQPANSEQSRPGTATIIPPADQVLIKRLEDQGIIVEKITEGSNQLSVNFVNVKTLDALTVRNLNTLKEQVTILKFTGQPLTNSLLKELEPFANLERLHLEKTLISDEGMAELKKFPSLETLNLYGTHITDQGLKELEENHLKKINLWNTKVTEQGIKTLLSRNPGLEVETGQLSLKKADSTRKN